MKRSKMNAFTMWGGYFAGKEACTGIGLSPRLPKGGQRRNKGVTPYGC